MVSDADGWQAAQLKWTLTGKAFGFIPNALGRDQRCPGVESKTEQSLKSWMANMFEDFGTQRCPR